VSDNKSTCYFWLKTALKGVSKAAREKG